MPRWLSDAVRAQLRRQKVPYYNIVDGPEPLEQRPQTEPHIVLQSDERTGDGFGPPRGLGTAAARNLAIFTIGMELLIFARSTARGATAVDHDDQARCLAKQLIVALQRSFEGFGNQRWRATQLRFLSREEVDERRLTQWPGRVYRIAFTFDDTVKDQDYKGAGADTIDGGDIDYQTDFETQGQGGNELPEAHTEAP
jgi:hypothetical protein